MKTVLVYGATGSQSRPVAHRLLDAGCYEPLTPAAFGAILGRLFGPKAGQAAERGYEAIARDPELFSPTVDMDAVLPMLPVTLTSLEAWARQHARAFSPAVQAVAS